MEGIITDGVSGITQGAIRIDEEKRKVSQKKK